LQVIDELDELDELANELTSCTVNTTFPNNILTNSKLKRTKKLV